MAGIVVCHWTDLPLLWWFLLLLMVMAGTGGLLLYFNKGEKPSILIILLTLTFFTFGALRGHLDDPRHDVAHWPHSGKLSSARPSFLTLRLKETPIPRDRSWRVLSEVERVDQICSRGDLHLYLRKDSTASTLRYGDKLLVHGYIDTERSTLYTTSDHYLVTHRDSTSLRARCEAFRMILLHRMQTGPLGHRYRGIAEALMLGWRGDLEPDLQTQFRDAGIMHMLCVSGLHVGLLAAIVGWLLFFVGKDRRGRLIRSSIQLVTIWLFVIVTGMSPATIRAALMFSLFIVSYGISRRTDSLNLLAAAAIAMLTVNPMLLFNVSWQLSLSAVTGILLMQPAIRLYRNLLWKAALVSIAATLATLPVSLTTYHQIQPYFLLANVVIVPVSGFLLGFSLLYMVLPCAVTATLVKWPLYFCDWLTRGISHLPGAVINDIEVTPWATVLIAAATIFIFFTINIMLQRYKHTKDNPLYRT